MNIFEKPASSDEYKKKADKIKTDKEEIETLDSPLGHLETDDLFANLCHETINAVASIPNIPRRKLLEIRVKLAQMSLGRMYDSAQDQATRLNSEYDQIIKKAIDTGDDEERVKFEMDELGMTDDVDTMVQEKIAIARELFESNESFPFPGLKPASYEKMKAEDAEYPGYSTPIDEILQRLESEGMKIVLGKNPGSGNVFVLPAGSGDIENDGLFPKHLSTEGDIDPRLRDLILKG